MASETRISGINLQIPFFSFVKNIVSHGKSFMLGRRVAKRYEQMSTNTARCT